MIYSAVSVAVANEKDRRRNEATAPRARKKGKERKITFTWKISFLRFLF
jgi:hypothetical protein